MSVSLSSKRRHLPKPDFDTLVPRLLRIARTAILRIGGAAIIAFVNTSRAYAQSGADPSTILTKICDFILGPFGQSLAVLGIIAIGVSWMFGRASLGLIAGVIGGIVIMFGASFIGKTLTGG